MTNQDLRYSKEECPYNLLSRCTNENAKDRPPCSWEKGFPTCPIYQISQLLDKQALDEEARRIEGVGKTLFRLAGHNFLC